MDRYQFREGAVVMMDALGFKGIWKHFTLEDVVRKLHVIEKQVQEAEKTWSLQVARQLGLGQRSTFLSDTIAIACADTQRPHAVVATAVAFAGMALHAGGTDTAYGEHYAVQLAYRGAIAYGEFYMEDRYLVGEAVDEAAE